MTDVLGSTDTVSFMTIVSALRVEREVMFTSLAEENMKVSQLKLLVTFT